MPYDTLLKVQNNSTDKQYMFAHNSQRWIIKPGAIAYVPFEAVLRSLGDPRTGPQPTRQTPEGGGKPMIIPARQEEINRLATLYGTYTLDVDAPPQDGGPTLRQRMPDVTVTNMDDETPILFPCDDPHCTKYLPAEEDQSVMANMTRQLERMKRQQIEMENILKNANLLPGKASAAEPMDDGVDEDSPTPVRTTPRQRQSA